MSQAYTFSVGAALVREMLCFQGKPFCNECVVCRCSYTCSTNRCICCSLLPIFSMDRRNTMKHLFLLSSQKAAGALELYVGARTLTVQRNATHGMHCWLPLIFAGLLSTKWPLQWVKNARVTCALSFQRFSFLAGLFWTCQSESQRNAVCWWKVRKQQ